MKTAIFSLLVTFPTLNLAAINFESCHSSKEYITTYNFLKHNKVLSYKPSDIRKIADEVSKGCKDSAKRFIKIYHVLTRSGLDGVNAVDLATKFANKSTLHSNTFITLFSESFLEKYLDLNIKDAVNISKKLSLDLNGDIKKIKNDFQNTVKFCLDTNQLNLNGKKCADIAAKVVESGTKYDKEMARIFLKSFKYLSSRKGTNLATYKALNLSLELIDYGPYSFRNFKDGLEFAREKKNLDMTNIKAIEFAKTMAKRSYKEILETKTK
jgi:hypothetical protein